VKQSTVQKNLQVAIEKSRELPCGWQYVHPSCHVECISEKQRVHNWEIQNITLEKKKQLPTVRHSNHTNDASLIR
jgi:hypothetical protein